MKPRTTAAEKFCSLDETINPDASPEYLYRAGLSSGMRLGIDSMGADHVWLTVGQLGAHFLTSRPGANTSSYVRAIVSRLGPHEVVEDLKPIQFHRWISGCRHLAASTRNHHVQVLAMMIKAGLQDGLLLRNPLHGIKESLLVTVRPAEKPILTVEQADKIIRVAQYRRDVANVVALRLFGGLEVSQATGLLLEDITTEIRVPGSLTLGGHEWNLYCPPNLRAWLDLDSRKSGPVADMGGKSMGRLILRVFRKAGVPHQRGVIENTWASYRRAIVGDVAKVFADRNYASVTQPAAHIPIVTKGEGERYFAISP